MINLLPDNQKRLIKKVQVFRVAIAMLAFLLFLVAASLLLILPTFVAVRSQYKVAADTIAVLEREGNVASSEEVAALDLRIKKLSAVFTAEKSFSVLNALSHVQSLKPAGITINRVSMDKQGDKKVQFFGVFSNRAVLQQFVDKLGADANVAAVNNPVSNFVKNQNGDFQLTVTFKE